MDKHKPSHPRWTEAQLKGIRTTGHSILVSAAAGSGKTAMLAERCAHLVCDAAEPCDVDELLVVTFTEAAALEMKNRIHAALRQRAEASGSERLARQVALIDSASVSTLHSFCARLLREHFHVVGLDPSFSVLDGEEAGLLRREIARQVFDDRYELDTTGDFQRFIDAYGEGDDSRLTRRVIDTHEMLCSLVNPQAWMARSRERIAHAAEEFENSELQAELKDVLARGINQTQLRCERAVELVPKLGKFPVYMEALLECEKILRFWKTTLETEGNDALKEEVQSLQLPRLKAVSNSIPNKELAKDAVDSVRGALTEGSWRDLLRFSQEEWQEGLRAIQPHSEVFLGLVEEFAAQYRKAKEASRVVDFSDLERFALEVLRDGPPGELQPSHVARGYHKQFAHVLVDEYQDINEVQDAILALLSRECVSDEPGQIGNLFSVGDVKQSIYRFRLAEAARFLDRQKLFRESGNSNRGEVIDLQSNFRSRGPLLEAINSVFERLMTADAADIEYDLTQRLHAGLKFPNSDGSACFHGAPIELHLLPAELESEEEDGGAADDLELDRSEREAVLAAQRIRRITGMDGSHPMQVMDKDGSGGMVPRPVRFGDIVVLLRSMRYKSEQYADVLRRAGIPVHAQSATGYFESMEVRDMLSLLSVLDNQRQDIPLAAVLRSPLARLERPEDAFAQLRLAYPIHDQTATPFHDAVVRYAQEKDDSLAEALRSFLKTLERWRHLAHSRPLADVIWTIYQESGYLAFCSGLHDGQQRVANLMDLHRRAGQFGSFSRQGLSRFMQFLESLQNEVDLGQPATASEADDVVRVMSIHRSKGLEFPVVILPDLGKRINLSDCQGSILTDRRAGLGMSVVDEHRMIRYPSLASVLVQRRLKQQALAEELRVLYVAMTRAREHLILIGTCKPDVPERWKNRWSDHAGAFPSDAILAARCMLDWLGPVAAASARAINPVFDVVIHPAQEVASWQASHARRPALTPQQEQLARLEPIVPAPPKSAEADQIIRRLEFVYPFEPFTRLAAADAVTRLAKSGSNLTRMGVTRELPNPGFVAGQSVSAADIGIATHQVLRHLDFGRPCDADDLKAQIRNLVEHRILAAAQADLADRDALIWFVQSELGALLRSHASSLCRELPIHLAIRSPESPESADPQDQIMLRCRVDVLVPTQAGIVLIDYKTDSILAAEVPNRAQSYLPQLAQYTHAIETMIGKPLSAAHLVFLFPRVLWNATGSDCPRCSS